MALIVGIVAFLLLLLVLLSVLDSVLHRLTRVELIVLAGQPSYRSDPVFQRIARDVMEVQLHLRIGAQFTIVVIAILTTDAFIFVGQSLAVLWAFLSTGVMVLIFRQILPNLISRHNPERRLVQLMPALRLLLILTRPLALPVLPSLKLLKKAKQGDGVPGSAVATEREIQAYLDVGEEDGIIEEDDSELIQSVVEFGDTLVKEIMTPRTEIVALPYTSSVRDLRELMEKEKHSRIPLFQDQIDKIVGMVYVRHILGHCEEGRYDTSVDKFVLPVPFVPETKKVGKLLKELQSSGANMAIVVDEFGGVAGLVTIEDLLEVIVGDIRDEDEPPEEDIRSEEGGSYWISGDVPLDRIEKRVGIEICEGQPTTASGLIIQFLGRVPTSGESFQYQRFRVKILHSDGRRIIDMRFAPLANQEHSQEAG